jgi:hypothetical protein
MSNNLKKDNSIGLWITVTIILLVLFLGTYLYARHRNQKKQKAQTAQDNQYVNDVVKAVAKGSEPPLPPAPVVNVPPPAPQLNVMSNDPTYVFASRINDSVSSYTWLGDDKTVLWDDLSARDSEFVKHVNNWFNGQFGGGKTMRMRIEEQWLGDKTKILNKLSSIGL